MFNQIQKIRYKFFNYIFKLTIGNLKYYKTYSKGINIIPDSIDLIKHYLNNELKLRKNSNTPLLLLDVGGGKAQRAWLADGYEYKALDINPLDDRVILGDICNCPEIPDNSFDVVMSFDVFEHVERPWDAAKECIRILKPNGLMIHRTLFAWRYHPCPVDYWRYTADGLEYLFNHTGKMITLEKGYDIKIRRMDKRGSSTDLRDKPPIDYLGGFRENWRTLYIGRKKSD